MENKPEFTENRSQEDIPFTNMSGDWMPWERGLSGWRTRKKLSKQDKKKNKLSKKEYRAVVSGTYLAMLPVFLCVLVAFGLAYLIIALWLA